MKTLIQNKPKGKDQTSFENMIAPLSAKEFYATYYEKRACIIHRNDAQYYQHLVSMAEINRVLCDNTLLFPKVKLVNSAMETPPRSDEYTVDGSIVHPARYLKKFSEGCTMVFSALHEHVPELARFCDQMTKYFSHSFQTNIYLTPANAQGFKPHYDTHDVFILQVDGSKKWRLYDTPIELSLKSTPFELDKIEPGEISQEFTLNAGDMLYIPRGLMHDAETTGETSLHITSGLLGFTWMDLLIEAILQHGQKDVELRKFLPIGFSREEMSEEIQDKVKGALVNAINSMDLSSSFDRFTDKVQNDICPKVPGQFKEIIKLNEVNSNSLVEKRPEVWLRTSTDKDDSVVIHVYGEEIKFPNYIEPLVEFVKHNESPFSTSDLPNACDANGKLVFIKRLIKEGVLHTVAQPQAEPGGIPVLENEEHQTVVINQNQ
ncbi:MAG: ribosomal protein L16 Arg81 hydroxylase [Flavobacteriales bacterium]|jgi:ribosomal protein L16 Arg81 hydroxylase